MKRGPLHRLIQVDDALLRAWSLPMPSANGDKEEKGRILLIGGSPEMPGAIMLAAIAALRAGAGKLTVATAAPVAPLVAAQIPEARVIALPIAEDGSILPESLQERLGKKAETSDVMVIGPGLESTPALLDAITDLVRSCPQAQVLLDAAAMDVVRRPGWRRGDPDGESTMPAVLLTPHAGEMAHLTGKSKDDVQADPENTLFEVAGAWQAVVALKGARTVIANPRGDAWSHEGGNSGLGVSGSGDTLAGIIGGLAARGAPLEQACVWGVALHARAGCVLAERLGPLGYLAREISGEIPRLMHGLSS